MYIPKLANCRKVNLDVNVHFIFFVTEEYTKITTPRQDVLFKKGYLGRKRPTAAPPAETTASNSSSDVANGNLCTEAIVDQNGGKNKYICVVFLKY